MSDHPPSCPPIELVDTHCHLTFDDLASQRDRVIAAAAAAGVTRLITIACRPDEVAAALDIHQAYPQVRIAAGIHPHEAGRVVPEQVRRLGSLWRRPGVVAAGEMGLDYHYDFSPRDRQESVFRTQLDLAAETSIPVVIHSREAHDDVVRLLSLHGFDGRRVVFHCFSGTPEQAAEIRAHGWRVSFTGVLTFRNASAIQQACAQTPLDEIMFETDAPYLSPEPCRKMRPNEPRNVVHIVEFAAGIRGQSFEDLARASTANACGFFNLSD